MRNQFIAPVAARVERIRTENDPTLALEPIALNDAQRLAETLADDDLDARFVLGWFHWFRYLALPEGADYEAGQEALRVLTPCFIVGAEPLPEPLLPALAENVAEMAGSSLHMAMTSSDLTLLTTAISLWRRLLEAAPASTPTRATVLFTLSLALRTRFEWAGEIADVDDAIGASREAVQIVRPDEPYRAAHLANLGVALRLRFERSGERRDLEEAITVGREAVEAPSLDDADHARSLSLLGLALRTRFEAAGKLADADEAIEMGREAGRAGSAGPDLAQLLTSLAGSLQLRFESVGDQRDLDEAITVGRRAVQVAQFDDPELAGYLSNLCAFLRVRFERSGERRDLKEAITVGREAVEFARAVADRAGFLSNLGVALRVRFQAGGAQGDLEEATTVLRQAVKAIPAEHPDRGMYLSNLGAVLRFRFTSAGLADADEVITEAVTFGRQAVAAVPAEHPDRAIYLSNLGAALHARFERSKAQADLDEAITAYTEASEVKSATPSVRVRAAGLAASFAAQTDTSSAARLLEKAVRLLPETTPRRLDRDDQQYALRDFAGLASDAAALTLLAGEIDPMGDKGAATRALQLLELGRGVLLSQALDTRSDLTDLQRTHPALAARFIELRRQLDQPGEFSALADDMGVTAGWARRRVSDRHQLAARFEATLTDIRRQHKTFLLPPEPDLLLRHAQDGPVVVVNVSQYRSDAIVLNQDGITSVPLPDLVKDVLIDRISAFQQALSLAHRPDVSGDLREEAQHTLSRILEWLWDAAAWPILGALGYRSTPSAGAAWPRVWWSPGGLLGLLPLHAAGYHQEPPGPDGGRRTVMDRVTSSYTPTVRALGYARERNVTPTAAERSERSLIVAMPTTPGLHPLTHVKDETERIRKRLPGHTLLIEDSATAPLPTKATVLGHLRDCAIVHFACHGSSDAANPSRSRLFLHDHDTTPLTVASLAPFRLDHARLAYLSACRTAFNPSMELIDEAIHLASAFQLAGYPHVVGTLWEIDDALSVDVADSFYTALTTGENTIDTTGAAQALHHAVRTIRDGLPATPSLWAAYLHAGA